MPVSEARKKANKKWTDANYTRVTLSMPNEEAKNLSEYCEKKGYTKAGFIRQSVKNAMDRNE